MPGEVHALIGENGAGKSTLSKILAGAVTPDSGDIWWEGSRVRIDSPVAAQRLGIGIVFQELDIFPNLSVAENIVIGNIHQERRSWVSWRDLSGFCRRYLEQVGLAANPRMRAGDLRMGEMQLLAVARALSFDAKLILMDEPTSSLSDEAAGNLFKVVRRLKTAGVTIVYVSHRMSEIFEIADRITVLRDGRTIGVRKVPDTTIDELIGMMVGRELAHMAPAAAGTPGEVVLEVNGLSTRKLSGVSFNARKGEVLGIAGLVGAGRSEIGAALFGLDRIASGSIRLRGREIRPRSPRHAISMGLGLLPEDRKLQGLMMRMSVLENSTMAVASRFQKWGFLTKAGEKTATAPVHRRLALKTPSDAAAVNSLSGGNQQKVLLSKWLLVNPDVLFLDDPTRGIDIGAKRDIYGIIEGLATQGKAVIFVSSELPELLQCCHRILVMREGASVGVLDGRSATQEQIMALATPGAA